MEKKFAKGFCFDKLFIVFVIGSIFGVYYEEIYNVIKQIINNLPIEYSYRRGVLYGPFNPLYGLGALVMTYFLATKKRKTYKTFIYASLLGGAIEYLLSFFQEIFIGTKSWDYTHHFLNINGRTTIPFMLFWGLLGVVFVKWLYPIVSSLIEKIPYKFGKPLIISLIIFLSLNMAISWTALFRQTYRRQGYPPVSFIGELCDKFYTDEYLKIKFPNMVVR